MRTLAAALLLLSPLVLAGCAEAARGPRVVTYSENRFYVRHVPARDSRTSVDVLAQSICADTGRLAGLESAYQFAPVDIRYATYRCSEPPAQVTPAAADAQPPAAGEEIPPEGEEAPPGT
ncbi:MAG: hypothetical protein JNM48_04530 [Rhodospirillales bacterium]|nr:hypothetical protein [Rhodospirillales bacterium]